MNEAPRTARRQSSRLRRSARMFSAPGERCLQFSMGLKSTARTCLPEASRCLTRWPPMKPPAPQTTDVSPMTLSSLPVVARDNKWILAQSHKLHADAPQKDRVVHEVPSPEPPRLPREPEEPLQGAALHPAGRLPLAPRMNVKCCPHSDQQTDRQLGRISSHETLLLGRAQADPDYVGPAFLHLRSQGCGFGIVKRAERRGKGAAYLQVGEAGLQGVSKVSGHALGTAVEEMSQATRASPIANLQHQVRPVHTGDLAPAVPAPQPHHGHPIGGH